MTYKLYYRKSLMEETELTAARGHFDCVSLLTDIKSGNFVIPRYSLYPFAFDQQREIHNVGAKLINSYNQYLYVADLGNYVEDLAGFTPKTWNRLQDLPEEGPFILKGETNSRKANWKRDMFALNKKEAIQVHSRLCDDTLIGQQKIYIREYVPLYSYLNGINGIPISKEFRFFVAYGEILTGAYYWANYAEDLEQIPDVSDVPETFLTNVINRVKDKINFFVMDVAQTKNGDWIVIELNDGCSSGLSCNEPEKLYANLWKVLLKNV